MLRMKELRGKRSQEFIASKIGLKQQTYRNYESGDRQADYDTLIKLSDYFGVSIDYLLGHDVKKQSEFNDYLIANEFFHKNTALLNEGDFIDLAKLFNAMTQEYKTRVLTYVMGVAEGLGLNVDLILNR